MIGTDHEQSRVFSLRTCVRLEGDGMEAGDLGKPLLKLLKDDLITLGLFCRDEGVKASYRVPGDREHLRSCVQLHGT